MVQFGRLNPERNTFGCATQPHSWTSVYSSRLLFYALREYSIQRNGLLNTRFSWYRYARRRNDTVNFSVESAKEGRGITGIGLLVD
jgi:hypothetical protein